MDYLQRYQAGECEVVWHELSSLGRANCHPDIVAEAEAVAKVTMERVAINVDRLIERLSAEGYEFGLYPDGEAVWGFTGAHILPDARLQADVEALAVQVGALPLALTAFWHIVGEVNFVGRAPPGSLPDYSDPLSVDGPATALIDLRDGAGLDDSGNFLCPIAPDVSHKSNVSGGAPYGIKVPDDGFVAPLRDEWHTTNFIPYLRTAIIDWGGFPGLSDQNPHDRWRDDRRVADWVKRLKVDLVAF